jgi:RHS repeat-associated protein
MSGYASNGNLNWYTQLNNGHGFEPAAIWADNIASVPGDEFQHKTVGWVRRYLGAAVPDNITATSLVDMNGDGLPDRVMSGYASDGNLNWGIQLNNGHGFEPAKIWSDSIACATGDEWQYKTIGWVRGDVTATVLIDMNGDGLPDRVMSGYASDGNMDWGIQLNNGHGFEPATIWADNIASAPGDAWQHRTIGWVNNEATATALIDMNGDGLPDRVMSGYGPYGLYQGSFAWYVQFNNGHGFEPVELWSDNIAAMPGDDKWQQKTIGWTTNDVTAVALVDINSDGLPDRVMTPYNLGSSYSWYVQLNNGHGFEPVTLWANNIASAPGDEWQHKTLGWVNRIPSATAPDDLTATALTDINGDGLTDRVMSAYSLGGPLVWGVQITRGALTEDPNTICPADTLVTIDNGLGGTTKVSYKPTTALGIDGVHCPVFLVTQIKVTDTQPSGSTPETYTQNIAYHDAYFDPADREFRGFAEVTVTDPITGNYTQTTFYQGKGTENPALKGRIKEIRAYDGTNASIFVETNAYVVSGVGPGNSSIAYPKLTQVDTTVYENGSGVSVRTRYEYDQIGNVTRETSDGDMAVTGDERTAVTVYTRAYGYGSEFNDVCRQELQDSLGAVVRRTGYIYDTRGNLKAETKWLETGEDLVTEYTYDDFGNRLAVIDALGHSTTTTYETTYNQFPATVTNGLGQVTQFVYDARFGVLTSQTDANGNTTTYSYDPLGRKLAVTDPYGRVVSSTSYPDFNTTITTDFYGLTTTQYIDGLKRAYKTVRSGEDGTAGKDVVSEKTYDNRGDLASESVPHYVDASPSTISYVRYTYDLRGRVIGRLEDYPGTADDALTQTEYLTPLSVKATDPLGHATTTVRDVYDHVVEVVDHTSAGDYHTFYQYDAADQLIRLTDDHANVTTITYDTLGRKTSLDDPDMGLTSYTYDLAGNLLTQTNAKSQVTTLTYDALNRITGRAYMDPNTTPVTYIYDQPASTNGIGKLTTVQDGAGTATYQYDTLGRATATTRTIDGIPYTTQTAYDAVGRVVQITYPDSEVVSYGYDVHSGLLESVTGASTYVAAITYDAQSRKKSVVYGNNVQMLYTYGNALRLARILSTNTSTSAVFQDLAYAYDKGGNITRVDDAVYVYTKTFQYDDLDRLIQADGIPYSPSLSWLYDSIGNMTFNSDIGSYTYGQNGAGPHAVTTAGSASYAYDANGDMVSGPGRTLFYDQENRLLYSIVGGADTAYTYDHSGQRVKQTTTGGTTIYVSNTFEVQAGASSHTTKHIFAGDQRVASITDGTASYYLSDHLGSSNLMVNAAGAVIQHVEYAPFGQTVLQTGQDITDYKFTGKELDGSGLYYYGARYYDPALCRFVTADSIVPSTNDSQQLNRYTYTLNNPVKATDPTGHYTLVDDALAAGFGALFGVVNLTIHDVAAGQWSPASAYVGAAVGGAVSGVSTLYVGPVLGAAAGGFVNSVVSQSLDDFEPGGKAGIDWAEVGGKTLEEGLTGFVFDKLPGIKGGVAAVGKRALTQLGTGTISKVSLKTAAKIVAYKATDKMCDSAWEAGKGYGERLLRDRLLRDRLLRERFLRERFQQPAPTNP